MTDFGTPGSFPTAPIPPSSGDRTGPPWEQPGAFFSRWIDTAKSILLDPMNGFSNVRRTGGLGAPLMYYATGAAPAIIAMVLFQLIGIGGSMMGGGREGAAVGLIGGAGIIGFLILLVVWFLLGFFIGTGIVHLVLSLLGGAKHGYEATARAFAYSYGSAVPIAMVPICGGMIADFTGVVSCMLARPMITQTRAQMPAIMPPQIGTLSLIHI